MKKFFVLYMAPAAVMNEWMQKPAEERQADESKMKADWDTWMRAHAAMIKETAGLGKTVRISAEGAADARNDLMIYSLVEGESQEAVVEAFKTHPHFGIPGATIEVMPANVLPSMQA